VPIFTVLYVCPSLASVNEPSSLELLLDGTRLELLGAKLELLGSASLELLLDNATLELLKARLELLITPLLLEAIRDDELLGKTTLLLLTSLLEEESNSSAISSLVQHTRITARTRIAMIFMLVFRNIFRLFW
jgi:hypothetical protein